jgi:CO dehydrogenase nickel-insertion accessory protein CooC1
MQVSFWSNFHQLGTTHNMIAIAVLTALEYRMRILMAHNHFDKSALEYAFIDRKNIYHELTDLSDTGIDALSRVIKFNKLEKNDISSYTTTILKNRLDLLCGTRNTNKELYLNNLKSVIQMILQSAVKYYELVFVDTASGNNDISCKIIEKSDLVIVNLNQNVLVLEDFVNCFGDIKDKAMIILSRYDKDSRYNLKAIKRRFGFVNIHVIPYNIGFADACSESGAIDFFLKNLNAEKDDYNYYFIKAVREAAEAILTQLGIDTEQKKAN